MIFTTAQGGTRGVIVAAALSCYGVKFKVDQFQMKKKQSQKLGITDFNKKYNIDDMVKGDVIFYATGVTSGDLADGVKDLGNEYEVNSLYYIKVKIQSKISKIFIINEFTFTKWKILDFKTI